MPDKNQTQAAEVNSASLDVKRAATDTESRQPVYQNRRYVGTRETVAYILNDVSASFNISKYSQRFIYDVVKISFNYLAILDAIGGVWDVINDTFIGVIVDRTRTRFGKFRPYLLYMGIPLTIFGFLYWLLPVFFPNSAEDYIPKFIFYFIFSVISETAGTFTGMASSGLLATITPNPLDRTRLITQANLLSGFVEKAPEILMGLMIDLVNHEIIHMSMKGLYISMGLLCGVISASMAIFFYCVSRERVMQSIERPSILKGLKSIINNKPLLLILLSDFLGAFSVSTSRTNYYIDVLGTASISTIVGIPGAFVSPTSYALVPWARQRFSTKAIWIFTDLYVDMCWLSVFAIGLINNNFTKKKVMIPVLMVEETIEMITYGLKKVIPTELRNEAMDYCEWKNGYRTEAMTGVAQSLILKLQGVALRVINNLLMKEIGYIQGKTIGTQTDSTKRWIFMLATGLPVITSSLGVVPKFIYNLTGAKRDKMYEELFRRREALAAVASTASFEELQAIGKAEISGEFLSDTKL